jgi:hypothetical protein
LVHLDLGDVDEPDEGHVGVIVRQRARRITDIPEQHAHPDRPDRPRIEGERLIVEVEAERVRAAMVVPLDLDGPGDTLDRVERPGGAVAVVLQEHVEDHAGTGDVGVDGHYQISQALKRGGFPVTVASASTVPA